MKKELPQEINSLAYVSGRRLTNAEFQGLAAMPAEAEWFANLDNPQTRRAYENDLRHFMAFIGIKHADEFRQVQRSHVIEWRDQLYDEGLAPSTVRRKLAAVSSLYSYLCNENAVEQNPAAGVRRPKVATYEGQTPILDDHEAAELLDEPDSGTLKGLRDRAILSTLLYQALRREELTRLRVKDRRANRGGIELVVRGKGGKTRFVPLHPHTARAMHDYLTAAGHINDDEGALFRAARGGTGKALSADSIYKIVCGYLGNPAKLGFSRYGPHSLRATAATNALEHNADIAKVQEWLGHASVSTTRVYDRRRTRPEDSPTFKIRY